MAIKIELKSTFKSVFSKQRYYHHQIKNVTNPLLLNGEVHSKRRKSKPSIQEYCRVTSPVFFYIIIYINNNYAPLHFLNGLLYNIL